MIFKIKHKLLGSRVHFTIFVAPRSGATFANAGTIILDEGVQSRSFIQVLKRGSGDGGHTLVDEVPSP